MRPVIIESMIRIEPAWLGIICLALASAVAALLVAWPIARSRWMHYGAVNANQLLARDLAKSVGKAMARGERISDLERDLAEEKHRRALLEAWATRGPELAAQPTEKQRRLVLMRGRADESARRAR